MDLGENACMYTMICICMYKTLKYHVSFDNFYVYHSILHDYRMLFDGFIHFDDKMVKRNKTQLLRTVTDSNKFMCIYIL